jgi:hypothetical protein
MRNARFFAKTCCVLLVLVLPAWNSRQSNSAQESTPGALEVATNLQIQSSVLRIEFDHNLRSRVVALTGRSPQVLNSFSASETVTTSRIWSDFALITSRREHVADAFGEGERLSLAGKSGDLRKEISVTIYKDFPSMAIFDVAYRTKELLLSRSAAGPISSTHFPPSRRLAVPHSGLIKVDPMRSVRIGCFPCASDSNRKIISV